MREWWERMTEGCILVWKHLYRESFHYFELGSKIPVDLYALLNFDNTLIDDKHFLIYLSFLKAKKNLENKESIQESSDFLNFTYVVFVLDPIFQTFNCGHYFSLGSLQFLHL